MKLCKRALGMLLFFSACVAWPQTLGSIPAADRGGTSAAGAGVQAQSPNPNPSLPPSQSESQSPSSTAGAGQTSGSQESGKEAPGGAANGSPQNSAADANAPDTIISTKEAKELFRSVDEILQFASQDTDLPIKHKVKRRLTGRDEVKSYVEKSMRDDKDAKRLERSAEVLKKFGLIPRDFDLPNFLVAMLREQVAGYYDVKTKTVNLLNWLDVDQQKPVLAHELTHALQDQSFGIEKWMKGDSDDNKGDPSPKDIENDEESSARQAVIEGQAMVVLVDYELAPSGETVMRAPQFLEALKQGMLAGTPDAPTFGKAPIFLKEELTFPYRFGPDFTVALLRAGGKKLAYEGVFENPPKTTREIMEPLTYLRHEKLPKLKLIDMNQDFKGYDAFDIGAMGEFDVDILVEQYSGATEAKEMYPAWRGGYYYAGKPKGNPSAPIGVLYVARWSSAAKAAEFAAVYAKSLAQRYKQHEELGADGRVNPDAPPAESWRTLRGRHAWETEEGIVVIEVRNDQTLISESLDDTTTRRVEADFWPAETAAPATPAPAVP
jgi:hypothetical protein